MRVGTSIPCTEDLDVVWVYCLVFGCWEHEMHGIKDRVIGSMVRI